MNNTKEKAISIAQETLGIIERGYYINHLNDKIDMSSSIDYAVSFTKLYESDDGLYDLDNDDMTGINNSSKLEVTNETTAQAAQRLLEKGITNLVALNFASAKYPGGGWLNGAQAQEEDLARCSALYPCLMTQPYFYYNNNACQSNLYTDDIIYSPKVPFFRDFYLNKLESPFQLSIITSPAPNARAIKEEEKSSLQLTLEDRAVKILMVAYNHGHRNIILGAWGCGVFGNDPKAVVHAFLYALEVVPTFDNVCFAVYDNRLEQKLYKTFKETIPNVG